MQDTEMANDANNIAGNTKPRTKKKSTLTKLKERKEREMGSSSSLQKAETKSTNKIPSENIITTTNNKKPTHYHVSTKDNEIPLSPMDTSISTHERKPQPKPRFQRRGSSSDTNLDVEMSPVRKGSDDHLNRSSDTMTLQRLKNLKVVPDHSNSSADTLANARFMPKPPVTPRSTKNTPRTPRTMGNREKRNWEPWSSGDEHEIEEKREKNGNGDGNIGDRLPLNVFDVTDLEMADSTKSGSAARASHNKPNLVSNSKTEHRLLKRRNSQEAVTIMTSDGAQNEITKLDELKTDKKNVNNYIISDILPNKSPRKHFIKSKNDQEYSNVVETASKPPPSPKSSPTNSGGNGSMLKKHSELDCQVPSSSSTSASLNNNTIVPLSVRPSTSTNSPPLSTTSTETQRNVSTPPTSARLEPISPRSHPPPLPKEFSSHALKTAYKIDPNIRPRTSSTLSRPYTQSDSGGLSTGNEDKISQRSFTSGSILPMITTKEARSRSFLEGSISSATPSMIGLEELERYFPERKINILVGSWNMNELRDVTSSLDDFILPQKCDYVQDIYAIGTQENDMNKKEWEIKLQETLGPSHVMYHSVALGSLHLVVFIRRDLIWFCSAPEDDTLSLRAVTMVKTKGAIGISFTLFGSSLLFINCHLTSDRDNENSRKKSRLGDYFKVIQEMDFKFIRQSKTGQNSDSSKKSMDITALYDSVFWLGDLNFRIERQRHAVEGRVNQIASQKFPNFETLLGGDQLLKYMMEGKIFDGFQEGRINFHPTFKFDVNTDSYDTSAKNRVPSYTDRILFRSKKKNDIACLHYDAVMGMKISDHKPVFGQFETGIKPGRDNMVYGAGHFDRSVYQEANQRRAANQPSKKGSRSNSSSVCSLQ